MAGFKKVLPSLLHAVDEGLSYSEGLYLTVEAKRTCFFSQPLGIFGCQSKIDGVPIGNAGGYTNLDRAIKEASGQDLTIVFTDGVPSGQSSGRDCVGSGVDAACVAEALSGVVRAAPGSTPDQLRGVWIVPIVTAYEGVYFAEQPILPSDFNRAIAESNVRDAVGVNARIDKPQTAADGTLLFEYAGPRFLLALVVGDADVSRAFLQEFFSRAVFSSIATLDDSKQYRDKGGTAILPALEVFPSAVPLMEYRRCQQSTDASGRLIGDPINCRNVGPNRFTLECRPKPSKAPLLVSPAEPSRPLHLRLLAPAKFSYSGRGPVDSIKLDTGRETSPIATLKLQAEASCNSNQPVRCGSIESRVELHSTADVEAAASELASASSVSGRHLQQLSTNRPALEPHKVYGLADLLENFYRRKLTTPSSSFATLEFCTE